MNSLLRITLINCYCILLLFPKSTGLFELDNAEYSNNFFGADPQASAERQITKELISVNSVNISEEYDMYRAYLISSTKQNITIFDNSNFGFHQLNFDLQHVGKFGNEGRGPGEFIFPVDLFTDQKNQHHIVDGHQQVVSIFSADGNLINEQSLPFGVIPHRYIVLESGKRALYTITGNNAFHILNENNEAENTFLNLNTNSSLDYRKRAFLLDGFIAGSDDTVYFAGYKNSMLKAFKIDGELIYSRNYINPMDYDFKSMEISDIRSAPAETLDIQVYDNKLIILTAGSREDPNRMHYLDVYNRENGDYLYTVLLEYPALRFSISEDTNSLQVLGYYTLFDEMGVFSYENPF